MVLVKRTLDNGFKDHHLPSFPKAPRSVRRRGLCQKSHKGDRMNAFDLLATVAGKLLEESECSSASSSAGVGFDRFGIGKDAIKKESSDVDKSLGGEHDEQGSSEGSFFYSGLQRDVCKVKGEAIDENGSAFVSSASSMRVGCDSNMVIPKRQCEIVKLSGKEEGSLRKCGESDGCNEEKDTDRNLDISRETTRNHTMTNKSQKSTNCPASTNSEVKIELPLFRDSDPNASVPKPGNNVKVACKDDDEIVSHNSQNNREMKVDNSQTHIGDPKMSKLFTSKLWNTAPKLKDFELSKTGGPFEHINLNKRCPYEMDRSQRNTPFKKRRLVDRSSVVTYDGGISCESVCTSPSKCVEDEKNASTWKSHEGNNMSTSAFGHKKTCNPKNSHVRLNIKSFKVPELFIEVPKNTTVCSLKKTVLEAVTTILGDGLHVGVLFHGKKIQDDNKTLLQTGLSQNDNMESVAFMLEPDCSTQPPQLTCSEDPPNPLPLESPIFVNRSPVNPNEDTFPNDTPDKPLITDSICLHDFGPYPIPDLTEKVNSDSKALVPVPEVSMEALAIVPGNPRPKRYEIGQRRVRRPFSVSEVEALVQAVEKLGTGRWRDVKLCAFENAKHRTYVDLKDKWKTLVHTARISPQQRRGEPVPQELLDRVLAAQTYWSENHTKQHGKQQHTIIPKLTNCPTVKA